MKKILVCSILLGLFGCGSDCNCPDPSAAITQSDSALLAEYQKLDSKLKGVDSMLQGIQMIELRGDSISSAQDSINRLISDSLISAVSDSIRKIDSALVAIKTQVTPPIDTTPPVVKPPLTAEQLYSPPAGNVDSNAYGGFSASLPIGASAEKSFPKALIGTFFSCKDNSVILTITKDAMTYGKDKTTIYSLSANNVLTIDKSYYLLNYKKTENTPVSYWVVDFMTFDKTTLKFFTIPTGALSATPSKKELKSYLDGKTAKEAACFTKAK